MKRTTVIGARLFEGGGMKDEGGKAVDGSGSDAGRPFTIRRLKPYPSFRRRGAFALGLVALFATIGFGQTADPAKLKVNGVGLDSTYAQVVKALGKPRKNGAATKEECIGGREKHVEFDGASFYFMDGDSKGGKTFEVKAFNVTSPKYAVSGLKVGDTELSVRRRLGTKFTKQDDEDSGAVVWSYEFPETGNPGFTSIYIKRGKIVKIAVAAMVC